MNNNGKRHIDESGESSTQNGSGLISRLQKMASKGSADTSSNYDRSSPTKNTNSRSTKGAVGGIEGQLPGGSLRSQPLGYEARVSQSLSNDPANSLPGRGGKLSSRGGSNRDHSVGVGKGYSSKGGISDHSHDSGPVGRGRQSAIGLSTRSQSVGANSNHSQSSRGSARGQSLGDGARGGQSRRKSRTYARNRPNRRLNTSSGQIPGDLNSNLIEKLQQLSSRNESYSIQQNKPSLYNVPSYDKKADTSSLLTAMNTQQSAQMLVSALAKLVNIQQSNQYSNSSLLPPRIDQRSYSDDYYRSSYLPAVPSNRMQLARTPADGILGARPSTLKRPSTAPVESCPPKKSVWKRLGCNGNNPPPAKGTLDASVIANYSTVSYNII